MHGASLKTNTKGIFDWEIAASQYVYGKDEVRAPTTALPSAAIGGAGRITDQQGTGWHTLALRGTLRPSVSRSGSSADGNSIGSHTIDFGVQRDAFKLRSLVSDTNDWLSGAPAARFSAFTGNTELTSAYVQDTWKIQSNLRASLGLRYENWQASNGSVANASTVLGLAPRQESHLSPKAAVAYDLSNDLTLKASAGRAVRFPTVSELYQGSVSGTAVINNDPNLKPERSVTNELSAEYALTNGLLRATIFRESTHDALYSQTNVSVIPNVTNIQNIDQVRTLGLELASQQNDVWVKGLSISSSITYADSRIVANAKFPASVGKWQPRVPIWRANLVTTYQPSEQWSGTLGIRFSGRQFGTLDNVDSNGLAYTGFSRFLVADLRLRYKVAKQWTASLGVDNLTATKYWAFHPYPQRTVYAEMRFDL